MLEIKHQNYETKGEFFIGEDHHHLAEMTYAWAGEDQFIIDHTYVDESFRGQGIAALLVAEAVTFAREHQKKVMPLCPFAKKEFDTKKEYQDLLN